jgi:phospholipid/cholesterol/gamma-HCH transport system substrate-binding protein
MHYSHRISQTRLHQIVGWFVIVPILILVAVLVLVAKSENLFAERYQVTTVFSEGYGLKPGRHVVLLGIQIGRVDKVEFTEQNDAKITMEILTKYRDKIRQNSIAKVGKSGGFIGDQQIEITVGNKDKPVVEAGGHIEAEEPFNIADLMAEVKPLVETAKKMLVRVEEITEGVHTAVKTGNETLDHVKEASTKLPVALENVKEATATIREAALSASAQLPAITASVRASVERARDAAEDVKTTTAKLPKIVDSVQGSVDNVKTITDDLRGTVHQDVPPLIRSVQGTVDEVSEVVAGAKKTFPISAFTAKGRAARSEERAAVAPRSLRADDVVKE